MCQAHAQAVVQTHICLSASSLHVEMEKINMWIWEQYQLAQLQEYEHWQEVALGSILQHQAWERQFYKIQTKLQ